MLICDRKGRGNGKKRRENPKHGEGESIVSVATNESKMERRKQARHNTMGKETLLSIPPLQARKNEDQGQPFGLYTMIF